MIPLHLTWWYFTRTCTLTTAWTLLNIKVKCQGFVGVLFYCVHAAAAVRGQYLALSKAWWSCSCYDSAATFILWTGSSLARHTSVVTRPSLAAVSIADCSLLNCLKVADDFFELGAFICIHLLISRVVQGSQHRPIGLCRLQCTVGSRRSS